MKIVFENLGPMKRADLEIGDLTIICGGNNTGKTYATHATNGLFDFLRNEVSSLMTVSMYDNLLKNGRLGIELDNYWKGLQSRGRVVFEYSRALGRVFASEKQFANSRVLFDLDIPTLSGESETRFGFGRENGGEMLVKVSGRENLLEVILTSKKNFRVGSTPAYYHRYRRQLADGLREALFTNSVPRPFLSSAERTGAAVFQRELDFTKNRLVEVLGDKTANLSPAQLLGKFSGEYPIAVRNNVDFIRALPDIVDKESYILKHHPDVLEAFTNIIGGEYRVSRDGIVRFMPTSNKRTRLTLVESSSGVRSLLDIGFYLRHEATVGDILIVDEPELNLHPDNQRKLARLFARLVNMGIKVFVTTHSDYIVKEFNTLIMLNQDSKRIRKLAKEYSYDEGEFLNHAKIRAYIAREGMVQLKKGKRKTRSIILDPMKVDGSSGMIANSFDTAIEEINNIQEDIFMGGDD